MPSPGAVCPAMVMLLVIDSSDCRWMVPLTSKTIIFGLPGFCASDQRSDW